MIKNVPIHRLINSDGKSEKITVMSNIPLGLDYGGRIENYSDVEFLRSFNPVDQFSRKHLKEIIIRRSVVKDLSFLCRMDLVSAFLLMVQISNDRLFLTRIMMNIISFDKEEKFRKALAKGEAVDLLFDIIDSMIEMDKPTKKLTANSLYIIGHLIPHYNPRKLTKYMRVRFIDYTKSSDLGIRRNGYFCLRMMIQRDVRAFPDKKRLLEHLLLGPMDNDGMIVEESLKAIVFLLESKVLEDIDPLIERGPLFEILSETDHKSISKNAEKVLFHINSSR